jgi:hypothetical protein
MKRQLTKKLTLHRETIRTLSDNEAMMVVAGCITGDGCGKNTVYTSCLGGDCTDCCQSAKKGGCGTWIPFFCDGVIEQ